MIADSRLPTNCRGFELTKILEVTGLKVPWKNGMVHSFSQDNGDSLKETHGGEVY